MSDNNIKYVRILLPLALPKMYLYAVPDEFASKIKFGIRVEVPLRRKFYSGLVVEILDDSHTPDYATKNIISVIDERPIIDEIHLDFWKWIARYYSCTLGEVMGIAIPSGLKLSSETKVSIIDDTDIDEFELSDDEYLIYEALGVQKELNLKDIQDILDKKTVYPVINSLLKHNILDIREELISNYKPKKVKYLRLKDDFDSEENLPNALELTQRSKHQTNALLAYTQLSKTQTEVSKSALMELAGISSSVVKAIVDKGIFEEYEKNISRLVPRVGEKKAMPPLSEFQEESIANIDEILKDKNHVLLHGITGSGKTRIYKEYIKRAIDKGGQVLFLVPEIGLTTQLVDRLAKIFGDDVYVFHSKLSQNDRVEIWEEVLKGKKIILAARSGIFLPFRNLKLIIVDEEHDSSYKQQNPAPRYNARDAAVYIGATREVKVILGSATPSLESYYNASLGKYGYVKLNKRFGNVSLPDIKIVDMRSKNILVPNHSKYSLPLITEIQNSLNSGEQVLLFQNRRGYSPTINCNKCGWFNQCDNCDVSMTYHKYTNEIRCHYCGTRDNVPTVCPRCGSSGLVFLGYGTEKIEDELKKFFPEVSVKRLDMDTGSTRNNIEKIIDEFDRGKIDILVGTQMITKGLDFENIGLVGIIDVDRLMQFPDFRAVERAFQLVLQVGGRAGRRKKQGKVVIQTYQPKHPMIKDVLDNDYHTFVERELEERQQFRYPPFIRIIEITIKHKKPNVCHEGSQVLALELKAGLRKRVIGPSVPGVAKIRGFYQYRIMIKIEKSGIDINKVKDFIVKCKNNTLQKKGLKTLRINIDVDSY